MSKIRVLLLAIHFPLSMSRYFERALQRRDDVDLITVGPYTATWIPWKNGLNVPEKYALPPTIILPFRPDVGRVPYEMVKPQLPAGWVPDIVLSVDAGICWINKPMDGIVAHVATDPHCLQYDHQRSISDKFFNMQLCYSKPGDIYLPYAYDPTVHYPDDAASKDTDAVLGGMAYENRVRWVDNLRTQGVTVLFENGPIFDEYRAMNNRARIGLNWSSLNDLNARAFELMAMKLCPVMNIVPDIGLYFTETQDYLGFDNMHDAVSMVLYAKSHSEDAQRIANRAYETVKPHTYDSRIQQILKECGF